MERQPIPYGKHEITPADIEAVNEALKGDFLTQGPQIEQFEHALAHYCGSKYAVVVANGTVALHLAYLALGLKKGQRVATSPITFVATTNAAIYCGAGPVFCDIAPGSFNLDTNRLASLLAHDASIVGIAPVHMAGVPCEMEAIARMAREKQLWVVEDACHALGTRWKDSAGVVRRVGDCTYSDITVFSFHPVKQLASGEGGALTTNSRALYQLLLKLRTHGITKDPQQMASYHGGWYYEMQELGFNYRITDMQCALARSQLLRLDENIAKRRALVQRYQDSFVGVPQLTEQIFSPADPISFHLYLCQAQNRDELYQWLRQKQIYAQVHYIPVYQQPYYRQCFPSDPADFPNAERYYRHALSLPLYQSLSFADQDYVIAAIKEFYRVG